MHNIKTDRYYPQERKVIITPTGNWTEDTYFGKNGTLNVGEKFTIIAVLADKNAQDQFTAYTKAYKGKEDKQGLEALPTGAVPYALDTVTRKR